MNEYIVALGRGPEFPVLIVFGLPGHPHLDVGDALNLAAWLVGLGGIASPGRDVDAEFAAILKGVRSQ